MLLPLSRRTGSRAAAWSLMMPHNGRFVVVLTAPGSHRTRTLHRAPGFAALRRTGGSRPLEHCAPGHQPASAMLRAALCRARRPALPGPVILLAAGDGRNFATAALHTQVDRLRAQLDLVHFTNLTEFEQEARRLLPKMVYGCVHILECPPPPLSRPFR